MLLRCLNDLFGYCAGTPEQTVKHDKVMTGTGLVERDIPACKRELDSCMDYRKASEVILPTVPAKTEEKKGGKDGRKKI